MDENRDDRVARPFADVLREIRRGALHDELTEGLADVVHGVELTGKAGKLVLTIAVKPSRAARTVMIADDVKVTAPRPTAETLMFAVDGVLSRTDPNQPELFGPRVVGGVGARPASTPEDVIETEGTA